MYPGDQEYAAAQQMQDTWATLIRVFKLMRCGHLGYLLSSIFHIGAFWAVLDAVLAAGKVLLESIRAG